MKIPHQKPLQILIWFYDLSLPLLSLSDTAMIKLVHLIIFSLVLVLSFNTIILVFRSLIEQNTPISNLTLSFCSLISPNS